MFGFGGFSLSPLTLAGAVLVKWSVNNHVPCRLQRQDVFVFRPTGATKNGQDKQQQKAAWQSEKISLFFPGFPGKAAGKVKVVQFSLWPTRLAKSCDHIIALTISISCAGVEEVLHFMAVIISCFASIGFEFWISIWWLSDSIEWVSIVFLRQSPPARFA